MGDMENKPNFIDKVVSYISPVKGAERMAARLRMDAVSHWQGADRGKRTLSGWGAMAADADSANKGELDTLRDRSRDLVRNNPLATGALSTVCTNVVGPGLKAVPQPDAKRTGMTPDQAAEWADTVKHEFQCWSDSTMSDARRVLTFGEHQGLIFRSMLESGDVFVNTPRFTRAQWPYRLTVQSIEADRVSNPSHVPDSTKMVQGIEKNELGEAIAYHVSKHHPGNTLFFKERFWTRIPANSEVTGRKIVLHLAHIQRVGQTRGVPYLSPVIESLKQLGRYTEAELMAAVVSGMFTVFVKTGEAGGLGSMLPTVETGATDNDDTYKMGNGAIVNLRPGESVEDMNPGRPNAKFDAFVMSIMRQIGVGLEIPYEVLVKHFTASYSASRAALLEAWKFFRMRRIWLARSLCQPVYESFLEDLITSGRITAPGFFEDPLIRKAYSRTKWVGPGKGHVDEMKEAQAAEKRIEIGISTLEDETIEYNGGDYKLNLERRAAEQQAEKDAGLTPAAAPPAPPPAIGDEGEEDEEQNANTPTPQEGEEE